MTKLSELVTVEADNEACVVLKVKEGKAMELITLGCFDGNETLFRVTKGGNHTATIWRGEKAFSWEWGSGGYTLVSDKVKEEQRVICNCIRNELGIDLEKRG
jgi:hypothetical protein